MSFVEGEITVEFGGTVGPAGPAGNAIPIAAGTVLANPSGVLANPVGVDAAGMRDLLSIDKSLSLAQIAAPLAPSVSVNATAGNLNGTYVYAVSFVTAIGETQISNVSSNVSPTNQRVDLTSIPIGPSGVTARKIWRATAANNYWPRLVTTINDNTTTTYTDNIADGSVTVLNRRMNTTGGVIYNNAAPVFIADDALTCVGKGSGLTNGGPDNTFFGVAVAPASTTAYWNSIFGAGAGNGLTTGFENSIFGRHAGRNLSTTKYNQLFGVSAGQAITTGNDNSIFGYAGGLNQTTADGNCIFGTYAALNNIDGGGNIVMGQSAMRFLADGSTSCTNALYGIYIGFEARASTNGVSDEIVIGRNGVGLGANTTVIGNSSSTVCRLWGTVRIGGTLQSSVHDVSWLQPGQDATSRGRGTGLAFYSQPTDANAMYLSGRIYSVFDSNVYDTERLTLQSSVTGTPTDTLSLKSGRVGINENTPDYRLDVNGTFGFTPGSSVTPVDNGDVVFEATSNTSFTIKLKGSDGTIRSIALTLA